MTHYVDVQAGKAGEGTKRTETRHARVSILINPPKRGDKWMGVQGGPRWIVQGGLVVQRETWMSNGGAEAETSGCPTAGCGCPMVVSNGGGEWW